MGAKFVTKPKLAWAGLLIVVLLGLLFLPGIRKRTLKSTLETRLLRDEPARRHEQPLFRDSDAVGRARERTFKP